MKSLIAILYVFLFTIGVFAQTKEPTVTLSPGKEYEAGSFYRFLFGDHWRDVWVKEIKFDALNLRTFADGLIPLKKGGGFQTKSLRFIGKDGHYWKFRSLEKDPSKILPPDLRDSFAEDIIKDQISSSNPYAALVVAPILDSLGILNAKPFLFYLPDDKKLGKFREEFGGKIGIMEIHPDVKSKKNITFGGAEKVIKTFDLFERLEEKRDEKANAAEYLKARLADIFLGDWDRHADQWKWARFTRNGEKLWFPIPRDRDQAFSKFDGLLPGIAESFIPQFNDFDYSYGNVVNLTWNGRFVDRRFLTELTKAEWDSVTAFVYDKLSDNLIFSALKKLPPEIHSLAADEIANKLLARREKLKEISNDYYRIINQVVDVYGTKKRDYVEIKRANDEATILNLFKLNAENDGPKGKPLYHKSFDNKITDEIRVFLNDGDDYVKLIGKVNNGILIRIIGGKGKDKIVDSSKVSGYLISVLPIPIAENKTKIYDSGKKTKIVFGPGTTMDDEKIPEPKAQEEKYRPLQRDRFNEFFFSPIIKFSSDNGLILGGGPLYYKYGFRATPYESKILLTVQYATIPQNGSVNLSAEFNSLLKRASVKFETEATGLSFTKYYGYGNESGYDKDLEAVDYYKLEQTLVSFRSYLIYDLNRFWELTAGAAFYFSKSELRNPSLLDNFPYADYGLGNFSLVNASINLAFDSRDSQTLTESGVLIKGSTNFYPKLFNNKYHFGSASFDAKAYFSLPLPLETIFGFRFYGKKIFGKFPFLTAAFLGGDDKLLGYRRERFSGNATLYGNVQLRIKLTKIKFLVRGDFGIHGFSEIGRVFTENNFSKIWHPSYGGGFWLSYLDRAMNFVFTFASSPETNLYYFGLGFKI